MPRIITRDDGLNFRLGRKRPVAKGHMMHLRNYLHAAGLPVAPAQVDYTAKATAVLSQMYGNDRLGDCVIAGGYHIIGMETSQVMQPNSGYIATLDDIIADYSAIAGYVPGDPSTDGGTAEPDAFRYWTETGFRDGSKLKGWLGIDTTNINNVKNALNLFENVSFAIELPDPWLSPIPSGNGFIWKVAGDPNPQNGHCFIGGGYDSTGVKICTWGMVGTIEWDAVQYYTQESLGGALYCLLSEDQIAKAQVAAPNGLNWTQLISDFDFMGGLIPQAAPAAESLALQASVPVHPRVSLFQAQQWASSDLRLPAGSVLTPMQNRLLIAKIQENVKKHWPKGE